MNTSFRNRNIAILLLLALLPAAPSAHAGAGNGTERGGGDTVVAEFRNIQTEVLLKIDSWRKSGILTITDQERERLFRTVDTPDPKKFLVLSKEHTCRKVDPDGNCLKIYDSQGNYIDTEVDASNDPDGTPPNIIVGRVRWAAKTDPLEKETLVLHELLSVSKIEDQQFEKSYSLKLTTMAGWQNFKSQHYAYIHKLYELGQEEFILDLTNFDTFIKTAMDTVDYQKCMDAKGTKRSAKKIQLEYCEPFVTLLLKAENDYLVVNSNKHYKEVEDQENALIAEYNRWMSGLPAAWAQWSYKETKQYLDLYTVNLNHIQKDLFSSDRIESELEKDCPSVNDFTVTISCTFNTMLDLIPLTIEPGLAAARASLTDQMQKLDIDYSSQINPI